MYEHDDLFAKVWRKMAELGQCDAVGGAEFRRVKLEFENSGAAAHFVRVFITEAANRPARSFPHTDVSQLFDKGGE